LEREEQLHRWPAELRAYLPRLYAECGADELIPMSTWPLPGDGRIGRIFGDVPPFVNGSKRIGSRFWRVCAQEVGAYLPRLYAECGADELIPMSTWPLPGPGRRCPRPARTTGPCRPTGRRATVRGRSLAKQGACGSTRRNPDSMRSVEQMN
jgi:hypothetical protein